MPRKANPRASLPRSKAPRTARHEHESIADTYEPIGRNADDNVAHPPIAWRWWFGCVGSIALLLTAYRYIDRIRAGLGWDIRRPMINEFTAVLGGCLLFFAVRALVIKRPLSRSNWPRTLPIYLLAMLLFSVVHTSWNWGLRSLIYPLAGLGDYHYGPMPTPYYMELPIDIILFTIMVASLLGSRQLALMRAQTLKAAQLERALTQSRLEALSRSLEPHFLFNTLNTISATMYQDVEAADQMIENLADLLRASLDHRRSNQVTVQQELHSVEPYLAILRARFEEQLDIKVDVAAAVQTARLPSMLLQPLLENSIRHGGAETIGRCNIQVAIYRQDQQLVVSVVDDGPGAPAHAQPLSSGLGLSTTAQRLELLYGDLQAIEAGNQPEGGFGVTIHLPYQDSRALA